MLNYAKPLHTLDLLIFPQNIWTCSCDESISVSICTSEKVKRTWVFVFFPAPGRFIYIFSKNKNKNYICMFYIIWMMDICIVEYCTEKCCVRRLYLFLKLTHFEFWFVLNTVFLALLFDCVNMRTSKWAVNKMQM